MVHLRFSGHLLYGIGDSDDGFQVVCREVRFLPLLVSSLRSRSSTSWLIVPFVSHSITMAIDGGLHRDVGAYDIFNPIEREVRKVSSNDPFSP